MIDPIVIQGLGPGVAALCTTRRGGVSGAPFESLNLALHVGDDPQNVQTNRQRLCERLPQAPVWLNQVHGTHVWVVDQDNSVQSQQAVPTADAAITTLPHMPLAIMTADCLPIVLVDHQAGILGVVHAGWRGLVQGVLQATWSAMRTLRPQMHHVMAWIGPGIGPTAFEVGEDVRQAFIEAHLIKHVSMDLFFKTHPVHPHKWLANLPAMAQQHLIELGAHSVVSDSRCTYRDHQQFFSYRREGQTGRFATVAWLTI